MPICELSLASGFSHQSHMTATFTKRFGMTPRQYRRSGAKCR